MDPISSQNLVDHIFGGKSAKTRFFEVDAEIVTDSVAPDLTVVSQYSAA